MFLDMLIGETPNDTWTLNFGEINHKTDVAIPKHFALELLKIKEEMMGLRAIASDVKILLDEHGQSEAHIKYGCLGCEILNKVKALEAYESRGHA